MLAGTSSNKSPESSLILREHPLYNLLHEVSRAHKSRQTESRLVAARDWERRKEEKGAEMEGEWQLRGRGDKNKFLKLIKGDENMMKPSVCMLDRNLQYMD